MNLPPGTSTTQQAVLNPRALITGINGQDGFYLAEWLLQKGYAVYGIVRPTAQVPAEIRNRLARIFVTDLNQPQQLAEIIQEARPEEIYHLAAHHFSSQHDENRSGSLEPFVSVNLRVANIALEIMRDQLPATRFFYAASAHIFGAPVTTPQTEETPQRPDTLYGISKSAGVHLCGYYRQTFGLFAAVGILYNHESARRRGDFITTQLARAAANAAVGRPALLLVRDLDAVVDWGAAQDYVRAMWLILQQPCGDDYVIASGVPHTVRDFARLAFAVVGLRADDFITQDPQSVRTRRLPYVGDNSKIRRVCGWAPTISFDDLVRAMVGAQLDELKRSVSR